MFWRCTRLANCKLFKILQELLSNFTFVCHGCWDEFERYVRNVSFVSFCLAQSLYFKVCLRPLCPMLFVLLPLLRPDFLESENMSCYRFITRA